MEGFERAIRLKTSSQCPYSVAELRKNFFLAGVLKYISMTLTWVPKFADIGTGSDINPPTLSNFQPYWSSITLLTTETLETADIEDRASL